MTQNVFTYGSLMFDPVWSLVVVGKYASLRASAPGFARFRVREQLYPGMIAKADGILEGMLYLDVSDDDLTRLDAFEGDEYERSVIRVHDSNGITHDSQTYLYRHRDRLETRAWLPEEFEMDRFVDTYCRQKLGF